MGEDESFDGSVRDPILNMFSPLDEELRRGPLMLDAPERSLFRRYSTSVWIHSSCSVPLLLPLSAMQMTAARKANDAELETAVTIATRFLTRARKANHRLLRGPEGDEGSERQDSSAGCGWTPHRVDVKTDEWYRVRTLPMYCTT